MGVLGGAGDGDDVVQAHHEAVSYTHLDVYKRQNLHCDVSSNASCEQAMAQAAQALGGIDVLVNNAGIVAATRIWDLPEDEFRRMVDVNLTGTYNVTRAALPRLLESERQPAIVNLGSTAALRGGGLLGGSHYACLLYTSANCRDFSIEHHQALDEIRHVGLHFLVGGRHPVSYTHLDVYKRQGLPGAAVQRQPGRLAPAAGRPQRGRMGRPVPQALLSVRCLLYTSRCV